MFTVRKLMFTDRKLVFTALVLMFTARKHKLFNYKITFFLVQFLADSNIFVIIPI